LVREGQNIKGLGVVTVPYGGSTRYSGTSGHKAVDIANAKGTPIPAFTGGRIVSMDTNRRHGDKGYGNYVVIQDEKGGLHRYSHLDNVYKDLQVGSQIKAGQYLGGMGDTGQTYSLNPNRTGVHLHYEVKHGSTYVDPFAYLISNFYNKKYA
jgi:murein DD-endopeptidase MepM/ murein hydrolase activator NlpD